MASKRHRQLLALFEKGVFGVEAIRLTGFAPGTVRNYRYRWSRGEYDDERSETSIRQDLADQLRVMYARWPEEFRIR